MMIVERIRRIDGTVGVITRLGWIKDERSSSWDRYLYLGSDGDHVGTSGRR